MSQQKFKVFGIFNGSALSIPSFPFYLSLGYLSMLTPMISFTIFMLKAYYFYQI